MASKYEINLNLLINNFKNASEAFGTDDLSALFFGNDSKKVISNVVFVPKQAEKLQSTFDQCTKCFSPKTEFIGCDDPSGTTLKRFSNVKLNASSLKTMSAQKLSTRLTSVKNNDVLSVPADGINIKVAFQIAFGQSAEKSLADSLKDQIDAIINQLQSSTIESDDSTLSVSSNQKGSTLKTLSKNWKKDSPTFPTFICRSKTNDSAEDLTFKLESIDFKSENTIKWSFSVLVRASVESSDAELHDLICKQTKNVLEQASRLFIAKERLFELDCLLLWLPNHNDFVHVVLPSDSETRKEFVDETSRVLNVSHSNNAFAPNAIVRLQKAPIKTLNLLANPHEFLKISPIGQVSIVRGTYHYHHYMQDNFDDSGWGCAYRSFQTVCSWLREQGHTDKSIPNHNQIQQCLVDIGDKPNSFVGSKKWIGSTELSFCMETLFGINSKILTTNSGTEIGEHARQILFHFDNYGGPVMIGGGMLAHTILGIDYNTKTGDCRYLILDPHYTGEDHLNEVLANGWCAWKPASFWNKADFYNLLLPLTAPLI